MLAQYTSKAGQTDTYTVLSVFQKLGTEYVHLESRDRTFDFKVPKSAVKLIEQPKIPRTPTPTPPPTPTLLPITTRPGITLFEHQKIGVSKLMSAKRFLLNDDMGLGKTLQAIVAADNTECDHVIVICPASLVKNWEREVQKFSLGEKKFYIYSYGKIPNTISKDAILILDESHYCKNLKAQRTQKILKLCQTASRVWMLTGTVLTKNVMDAYVPLSILYSSQPSTSGYFAFGQRYAQVKASRFGTKFEGVNEYNLPLLKEQLSKVVLTRKKHEVLDLPAKIRSVIPIKVSPALAEESAELFERYSAGEGLAINLKSGKAFGTVRKELGIAKVKAGLDYIKEQFGESDESLVIFAYHRDVVQAIETALGKDCVSITGDTSINKRQEYVDAFQSGKVKYIVLNIIAGGTGLTLTRATNSIFFEVDVTPASNLQAEDRIHRIGQTGTCNIHYLCAEDSLDDRMFAILNKKTEDINRVMS